MPREDEDMTLISVRVPTTDLEALRLVADATGGSVAHEIRSGVRMRLAQVRHDPDFVKAVKRRKEELDRFARELGLEDLDLGRSVVPR